MQDGKNRIMLFRFSAMGDVALLAPVLEQLSEQHPQLEFILVSRPAFRPFFEKIPQVRFHPIHPHKQHKGFWGLFRLFRELRQYRPSAIADLHDNIRSRVLSFFFRLLGYPIRRIDKGRKEKKALVRQQHKQLHPLRHTADRYGDVFRELGYSFSLAHTLHKQIRPVPESLTHFFQSPSKRIGIAPFAQHAYKIYPLPFMEEVIATLSKRHPLFIFGGGQQEQEIAETWAQRYHQVINTIGTIGLSQELDLMANLDLVLSMDSSGMHMASLVGTRVISIWGPTHPDAGFLGFGQQLSDCLQIDHPARPSSIYGNKPCLCDGIPCIERISPKEIIDKIENSL